MLVASTSYVYSRSSLDPFIDRLYSGYASDISKIHCPFDISLTAHECCIEQHERSRRVGPLHQHNATCMQLCFPRKSSLSPNATRPQGSHYTNYTTNPSTCSDKNSTNSGSNSRPGTSNACFIPIISRIQSVSVRTSLCGEVGPTSLTAGKYTDPTSEFNPHLRLFAHGMYK
jgi:hypothetical protein